MKLVHASLGVQRVQNGSVHHCGGLVKVWNGIFNTRKDLESSFKHSGSPVKLMHAPLGAMKGIERVFRTVEVQLGSFMPVCESGGTLKAVFITVDVM